MSKHLQWLLNIENLLLLLKWQPLYHLQLQELADG